MDTNTLRTFIALAQIKNFTKTAQQLFVAQSTVTNRIHDLETELGKELFVRTHKNTPNASLTWKSRPFRIYKALRHMPKRFTSVRPIRFMSVICKRISAPI